MGQDSNIEWTHHTFNPWRGCTKVSAGCANCYAEKQAGRNPRALGVWGKDGVRVIAAESYWRQPLAWNKAAEAAGERHRVFCASMADVFEGADTMPAASLPAVRAARVRLFELIRQTPHLDWLLLTKRPENWRRVLEETMILSEGGDPDDADYFVKHGDSFPPNDLSQWLNEWLGEEPPKNVWMGASAENATEFWRRRDALICCPAVIRFLSIEPLLGPIKLGNLKNGIDWFIVGGESQADARPMHPEWARSIRDECVASSKRFFFKQWGEWASYTHGGVRAAELYRHPTITLNIDGRHLKDEDDDTQASLMVRVGKLAAGRKLDGRTWDQFPEVKHGVD